MGCVLPIVCGQRAAKAIDVSDCSWSRELAVSIGTSGYLYSRTRSGMSADALLPTLLTTSHFSKHLEDHFRIPTLAATARASRHGLRPHSIPAEDKSRSISLTSVASAKARGGLFLTPPSSSYICIYILSHFVN